MERLVRAKPDECCRVVDGMVKAAKKSSTRSSSNRSKTAQSRRKQPWDKANPRKRAGTSSHHLTPSQEAAAKAMAKRAGRPYPNLVDNMRVAKKAKKSSKKNGAKTSKSTKTKPTKRSAAKSPTKTSAAKKTKASSRKTAKKRTSGRGKPRS